MVLRYLKVSSGKGVHIIRCPYVSLEAFVDEDWLKWVITRNTISMSSAEAEYRAMASATSEVVWVLKFLQDLD